MTAIETTGLTKRFGDVTAVEDLDLTVEDGEVFGFLGPNGAGKSTVIDVLLDFVRPTAGSATVLGHDAQREAAAIRRRTGVLPEGGALYERLTGREHLEWVARANGLTGNVGALLERVGLSAAAADRAVRGYSKGMRQRLAFGMALVGDPDLLILDEPSSGLDPRGMQDLRGIVREEASAGRTVFFSSHLLGEVEAVCDRIGIMNDGRLVATGTPDELRTRLAVAGAIRFEVADVPDTRPLESVDGVESVTVDGTTVEATVTDATAKIDVATRLARETGVLDVHSEDGSLERLFNSYTSDGLDGHTADTPDSDTDDGLDSYAGEDRTNAGDSEATAGETDTGRQRTVLEGEP